MSPKKTLRSLAKILCCPKRLCLHLQNICILSQKYCVPQRNFAFAHKTFAFAKKVLHSLKKFCICSQNICILLQKYCIRSLKFPLTCKTFAFSLNICISLCNKHNNLAYSNVFWSWSFLGERNTLASKRKCFVSKCKVFWGNEIFLRVIAKVFCWNAMFLWANKNVSRANATFRGGMQKFCNQTQNFSD